MGSGSAHTPSTPHHAASPDPDLLNELVDLCRGRRIASLTGAGISTDAGLPDYRGTGSSGTQTVDIDRFLSDAMWRRWVWQRNQETWKAVEGLPPTPAHRALAHLEAAGLLSGVATQNVDGLHTRAGSERVAEMHGSFLLVDCLDCGRTFPRQWLDTALRAANPWIRDDPDPAHVAILAAVDEAGARASRLVLVPCPVCGGILKPDVVFFGEALPEKAMADAMDMASHCEVLLVVGTSAKVSTAMWVALEAARSGAQLVVVNRGPCDLDRLGAVALRIDGGAGDYLPPLAHALTSTAETDGPGLTS